jgi:D-xylose transport system substrate-binding protein
MRWLGVVWVLVGSCLLVAACSPPAADPVATRLAARKIALLLPETKTSRYESADRPFFEARLKNLCAECQLIYSNASQDVAAQEQQAEAALTNGARVLVLDPVDSAASAVTADKAREQGVPVVAYDRLILNSAGVSYYISFDNERVGQLQAQSLVDRLKGPVRPRIVMINGSPTDYNAGRFKQGAHGVFDPLVRAEKFLIAREYDTPDWSPDKAQTQMQQALTALGNGVDGVYAANDGTASGAIAAMKAAQLEPLPPVTGQDAELAAVQRILAGEQYMTVYKTIRAEAEMAADIAFALLSQSEPPTPKMASRTFVNNGRVDVPTLLLTPVAVTRDNISTTIVHDGFWSVDQICNPGFLNACHGDGLL